MSRPGTRAWLAFQGTLCFGVPGVVVLHRRPVEPSPALMLANLPIAWMAAPQLTLAPGPLAELRTPATKQPKFVKPFLSPQTHAPRAR